MRYLTFALTKGRLKEDTGDAGASWNHMRGLEALLRLTGLRFGVRVER